MPNLTDEQKTQIEIALLKLQAQGHITDEQLGIITRTLFNIEWTELDDQYERRATQPNSQPGIRRATA